MGAKCGVVIAILLLVIAGGVYKFMFQGSVAEGTDGRVVILMTGAERNLVLSEMRAFLASVQQIVEGVAGKDLKQVAEAARKVGRAAQTEVPGTLIGKLPMAFKQMGFDTHSRFDQIAMDAESFADEEHALTQLAELMGNCVACHAGHQIRLEP